MVEMKARKRERSATREGRFLENMCSHSEDEPQRELQLPRRIGSIGHSE
jgi:hypothetical protein